MPDNSYHDIKSAKAYKNVQRGFTIIYFYNNLLTIFEFVLIKVSTLKYIVMN